MTLSYEETQEISFIAFAFGLLSLICSIFTLVLIYFTRKWTGYLLLLLSLTMSQILYDINYMLRLSRSRPACLASMFMDVWGGLGISFWTNILAFVVAYTVVSSAPIKIFQHYPFFSIYGTLIPFVAAVLVVSVPAIVADDDNNGNDCHYESTLIGTFAFNLYYWGRFGAIFLTVIFCTVTLVRLRTMQMRLENSTPISGLRVGQQQNRQQSAGQRPEARLIFTTVSRMNYYALAQVVCRSGAAWNEWNYGEYSTFSSNVAAAICSPSTGVFSFIIFLVMQPNAYRNFCTLLTCRLPKRDGETNAAFPHGSGSKPSSVYSSNPSVASSSGAATLSFEPERESAESTGPRHTFNQIFFGTDLYNDEEFDDDEILVRYATLKHKQQDNMYTSLLDDDDHTT